MRTSTFDVYRLKYDPNTRRILSRLIQGGFKDWDSAANAQRELTATTPDTFTIRICTHSEETYLKDVHSLDKIG